MHILSLNRNAALAEARERVKSEAIKRAFLLCFCNDDDEKQRERTSKRGKERF